MSTANLALVDMSTGEIIESPENEINQQHRLARTSAQNAIEHAIRCGELLALKKHELRHGEFKPWIAANCEFSYESAKKYMQVSREAQKGNALPFSSLREALGYDKRDEGKEEAPTEEPRYVSDTIAGCETSDLESLETKFGCIYADPPWRYGNQGTRAATGNHYNGMSIAEICALPIERIAADKSHLHLWTTNGFLKDSFEVMQSWGFEYKSCFVWVKPQMGIGNYWRVSHEFMLLGTRGSCTFANKSLMSWASFNRTKHSAKPDQIRRMIETASPGPYLELFARRLAPGWVSWGNEIERAVFEESANG